jgi:DNA-binding CsgD family transcriptional regulator
MRIAEDDPAFDYSRLTEKEKRALELFRGGMSTRNIALALGISRGAARDRIKNAIRKLSQEAT